MREKVEVLKHHADFPPNRINMADIIGQLDTINNDFALLMLLQPIDATDEGGFSRAGWPTDDNSLALINGQIEILENMEVPVPLVHALNPDDARLFIRLVLWRGLHFWGLCLVCHRITHQVL